VGSPLANWCERSRFIGRMASNGRQWPKALLMKMLREAIILKTG